jgi:hypothetical protein
MYEDQFRRQEKPVDRVHERDTVEAFCKRYPPLSYEKEEGEQDFRLYRNGQLAAVAEAKWRNITASKHDTYTIDKRKIHALNERAKMDRVNAYLLVSWKAGFSSPDTERDRRCAVITDTYIATLKPCMIRRGDRDEFADEGYEIPIKYFLRF